MDDILSRKEDATLKTAAALLHRASLLPSASRGGTGGESMLDRLDDNSHEHAFAISEDLKHALASPCARWTAACSIQAPRRC